MGGRNLARISLGAKALDKLPVGTQVIDADMDIWVKQSDLRWLGLRPHGRSIVTSTLVRYGPIKLWKAVVTS
jgi:hypothetical protein